MNADSLRNRLGQTEAEADRECDLLLKQMRAHIDKSKAKRAEQQKQRQKMDEEELDDLIYRQTMRRLDRDLLRLEGPVSPREMHHYLAELETVRPIGERQVYLDTTNPIWVETEAAMDLPGESIRSGNAILDDPTLALEGLQWTLANPDYALVDVMDEYCEPGGLGHLGYESLLCGTSQWLFAFRLKLPNAPSTGAASRLVPGRGLVAHERAGGHLIARHLGKTDVDLAARLVAQPRITGASSFGSRALAENAVASAIDANQAAIGTWLRGSGNRLVLNHNTGSVVGRSLSRGATSAVDARAVRVVLQRDPSFSGGFRIITGFPTP